MHALETAPPQDVGLHLTSFRDLERHCHNEAKYAGYQRLLTDFGIDVSRFAALATPPRLILAEQPGCWFCADDLLRFRLFRVLTGTLGFGARSGVLSLASDAFTCRGIKKLFFMFQLHRELGPVPLVGAAFLRRNRNRTYHALRIAGSTYERVATILDLSLAMLDSAAVSPKAFAEETMAIFRAGVRSGLRPLLPAASDRGSLVRLALRLAEHDLRAARRPLAAARRALADGISWVPYWDGVNGAFFGARVGKLGPLFNRFLLAVADPLRMARQLLRLSRHPAGRPLAVAAIFGEGEKYRMVYFDPQRNRFFYRPSGGARRDLDWTRIRSLAACGRTGGPAGTLEYLLMAAAGIYLVADPCDGLNRFERQAREIHQRYTGLPFPYVALDSDGEYPAIDYLRIFEPDFEARAQATLDRFFA